MTWLIVFLTILSFPIVATTDINQLVGRGENEKSSTRRFAGRSAID
jgi:hypothetical protein